MQEAQPISSALKTQVGGAHYKIAVLTTTQMQEAQPISSALQTQVGGSHYKGMKIQHVEFVHANNIPYIEANAIKYICRHRQKNGRQDIEKAIHYLQILLDLEYHNQTVDTKQPLIPGA